MTVSPKLAAALDVFRQLGWDDAEPSDVEGLPLGTAEQRRVALAGLRSGKWGEFGRISERGYGWISWVDVDTTMLALFAIRMGVDASRAARLMPGNRKVDDDLATRILAARGPQFAARFIEKACGSSRRAWEHSTSVHAGAAVRLVAHHHLPVPDNVQYLKDWAVYALGALAGDSELFPADRGWCDPALIEERYKEHARSAVAVGVPATGPFSKTLVPAVTRGWLTRDEALELVFIGLDTAQRPGDRVEWARVLTNGLGVSDAELVARADAVVSVLAFGDTAIVEAFGPVLIGATDDDIVSDVLVVGLAATAKKARLALLAAAAQRTPPRTDVAETVTELISPLAGGKDRALAKAATRVMTAWALQPADSCPEPVGVHGWWSPTPPLWEVPRFDAGETSVDALVACAGRLSGRPSDVVDDEVERFLVLANASARRDEAGTRDVLRGVRGNGVGGLRAVPAWVEGSPSQLLDRTLVGDRHNVHVGGLLVAREAAVFQRLGAVPCLLSSPTWDDLRIDPHDLLQRLNAYVSVGATASEADLFLALTRLDLTRMTEDLLDALGSLGVPVVLQSGETLEQSAGSLIVAYIADPVREPELTAEQRYWAASLTVPASLASFPNRLGSYGRDGLAVFPSWGDGAGSLSHTDADDIGLRLRQAVRRATPLTPALAAGLIDAQRGFHRRAAADGTTAVIEAWDRGLLQPRVADMRYVGRPGVASNLAALARVAIDLAEQGIASVMWPILDDLVHASARQSRIVAGTAEVADAILAMQPEAQDAVGRGIAPATTLDLPGVRALAGRDGSSRAVTVAREMVALLPEPVSHRPQETTSTEPALDDIWPSDAGMVPAVVDAATLSVQWLDPAAPTRLMAADLALPERPGEQFRVVTNWYYALRTEGQCGATSYTDEPPARLPHNAWLHWDADAARLVVEEHRNWRDGKDGPLRRGSEVPPLTTSLVGVALMGLCHDGSSTYAVQELVEGGLFGAPAVQIATRALLAHPDVSMAKIVRVVDDAPTTLAVMWPVLVESVRFAAGCDDRLPTWLNRVLDVALSYAGALREAGRRGWIPAESAAWPGLSELAGRSGSSAALKKARTLLARVAPES